MGAPLVLALALSFDGFLVGLTYGLRGVRLPWRSLLILAGCTGAAMSLAIFGGLLAIAWVPERAAHLLGAAILIALGLWRLLEAWVHGRAGGGSLLRFRIPGLGVIVEVLQDPLRADRDLSGAIDPREAVVLGLVLALDAGAAGLAAAYLVSEKLLLVLCVTAGLPLLTLVGVNLGRMRLAQALRRRGPLLPAMALIVWGLLQL